MNQDNSKSHVREIRPKIIFQEMEARHPVSNMMFSVAIPSSAIGGMTLLESSILVSLAKLTSARAMFEFGTYMGATSLLLAVNSPAHARITTLDLPPDYIDHDKPEGNEEVSILQNDVENDNYLRRRFAENGASYIDRADPVTRGKILRILQDSRSLDIKAPALADGFDFIFIDGGHDYETIATDTAHALQMAKSDAIIIWHDYRSKIHGDVTRFIDHFSLENSLMHVQNTMLAFMLKGEFNSLLPD